MSRSRRSPRSLARLPPRRAAGIRARSSARSRSPSQAPISRCCACPTVCAWRGGRAPARCRPGLQALPPGPGVPQALLDADGCNSLHAEPFEGGLLAVAWRDRVDRLPWEIVAALRVLADLAAVCQRARAPAAPARRLTASTASRTRRVRRRHRCGRARPPSRRDRRRGSPSRSTRSRAGRPRPAARSRSDAGPAARRCRRAS